ncbi:MAG: hypothetical protein J6Y24_16515 [Bacteroidales bacterium]|nr:hypothetical protein [Bacteroidales bacterium]
MKKSIFGITLILAAMTMGACSSDDDATPNEQPTDEQSLTNPDNGTALSGDSTEYIFQHKSAKRGIGFNRITAAMAFKVGNTISWAYNWSGSCDNAVADAFDQSGVEFVPMAWNSKANYNDIAQFVQAHPNTKHILGYNEPNLTDQCNETPTQTAQTWPNFISFAKNNELETVSPAMNYGTLAGYSDPWKWLDEFYSIDGINLNDISATAAHCYMSNNGAQLDFAKKFEKYNKPVWITEFAAWENEQPSTAEGQQAFLAKMVNAFEQTPGIGRYAWFMFDYSQPPTKYPFIGLVYNQYITDLGLIYFNMSSFDSDLVYPQGKWFPAEHYRACSNDIEISVSTDPSNGILMISGFNKGKFAEYKVKLTKGDNYLNIRYTANRESEFVVQVDGNESFTAALPSNGDNWLNAKVKITSDENRDAVIRISVNSGRLNINRLAVSSK